MNLQNSKNYIYRPRNLVSVFYYEKQGVEEELHIPYGLTGNGFELDSNITTTQIMKQGNKYLTSHIEKIKIYPFNLKRVEVIRAIARTFFLKTNSFCTNITSYGLKHILESFLAKQFGNEHSYVSNGDLILALSLEGFEYKRFPNTSSINCVFKISQDTIKLIENNKIEFSEATKKELLITGSLKI